MKIAHVIALFVGLTGSVLTSSAQALCHPPSGTYVGNAAGQAIQPDVSGANIGPGITFANITWSFTFTTTLNSDGSGSADGNFVSLGKAASIPVAQYNLSMAQGGTVSFKNWLPAVNHVISSNGTLTNFTIMTTRPSSTFSALRLAWGSLLARAI